MHMQSMIKYNKYLLKYRPNNNNNVNNRCRSQKLEDSMVSEGLTEEQVITICVCMWVWQCAYV